MKSWDPSRIRIIILALVALMALSGCSAVKLGYANLPHLAYLWLDRYVDLSDEQSPAVREELARLHMWHRQHELPRVLDLLARVEQMAPGEVTSQQACTLLAEGQSRMHALADAAEPRAAALAATLTGRELRHLERRFRRNNERWRKDMLELPPAQQLEKRLGRMVERAERVYGRLDEPQRALLRQRLAQSAFDARRSHLEWQRRQQDLLQVLRRVNDRSTPQEEARTLLRGWYERIQTAPDPGYRAYQQVLRQEGCATFALLHQSTTAAQRAEAVRRLRGWQHDLRELVIQQP